MDIIYNTNPKHIRRKKNPPILMPIIAPLLMLGDAEVVPATPADPPAVAGEGAAPTAPPVPEGGGGGAAPPVPEGGGGGTAAAAGPGSPVILSVVLHSALTGEFVRLALRKSWTHNAIVGQFLP